MRLPTVFGQLLQWIPRDEFQKNVDEFEGDKKTRKLKCWGQFVALLFGQLTGHSGLRPITAGLKTVKNKLYHLGVAFEIHRSTLSDANDKRDSRIFEKTFYQLLPKAQRLAPRHKFRFKGKILAMDSTTIELCLSLSPWAQFHHGKGAMKLHMAVDLAGDLPVFMVLSDGRKHDMAVAKRIHFAPQTMLLVDRGYVDYAWLWQLTQEGTHFVTRLKKNHKFKVLTCSKTDRTQGIMADQVIRMTGIKGSEYEGKLRRVSFRDPETGKHLVFITNRFDLSAKTICALYKARWDVELFFKTMKQHLQIKKFLGTSVNAVKAQVWVALIAYLLMMIIKYQSRLGWSTPAIMASLTVVLFSNVLMTGLWGHVPKERCYKLKSEQLLLFDY
ncbi:MAG: IS4 family transposase [Deltaproteobacteria bacterium]|nr:IS4 family transposase [Deltaproteobacteria bacterium]